LFLLFERKIYNNIQLQKKQKSNMKKISLSIVVLLFTVTAFSQTWVSDLSHSRLGFSISHLAISTVTGNFKQFEVKATTAKADYSDVKIEVTAQIASINTDDEKRDAHLNGDDFFDSKQFPTLTFKSTSVTKIKDKNYKLLGNLTMHGVTKPVVLNLVFVGKITNPMNKKEIAVFKVSGILKRSDFGVGSKFPAAMVGNEVKLIASVELSPAS